MVKDKESRTDGTIGLALSGGGARAIAFHLGCLRALNSAGLLSKVSVISSVSGGSVVAAMYAFSDDSFEEFDARVIQILKEGLRREIILQTLNPKYWYQNLRVIFRRFAGQEKADNFEEAPIRSALARALEQKLFNGITLSSKRRDSVEVVINSCDLLTGTAFRFGSSRIGSWRLGECSSNKILVSDAVAASASYPLLLPPVEMHLYLTSKTGSTKKQKLWLTDGGVFDNLGTSCLDPNRSEQFSFVVYRPSHIICCNAGPGELSGEKLQSWWLSHLQRAFAITFKKLQESSVSRLHQLVASRQIDTLILSFLGQDDSKLKFETDAFVNREQVVGYPTDFSPMSETNINLLTSRGEQLTQIALKTYGQSIVTQSRSTTLV